jgi:hypothetical protein
MARFLLSSTNEASDSTVLLYIGDTKLYIEDRSTGHWDNNTVTF